VSFAGQNSKQKKTVQMPLSGAAGPAGCRLQRIREFCGAKLKAKKTARKSFSLQRKGL
jgi:hypothetical protein